MIVPVLGSQASFLFFFLVKPPILYQDRGAIMRSLPEHEQRACE